MKNCNIILIKVKGRKPRLLTTDAENALVRVIEILLDSGNQLVRVCGVGGVTITLDCIDASSEANVAIFDLTPVQYNQLEDSSLYRDATNTLLSSNGSSRLHQTEFAKPRFKSRSLA